MTSIRSQLLTSSLPEDQQTRISVFIPAADKRTVMSASGGEDAILSFIVQHAFRRAAEYVRKNRLDPYDTTSATRTALLEFIRADAGCDSPLARAHREAVHLDVSGRTTHGQPTPPQAPVEPALDRQTTPGGVGRRDDRLTKIKDGVRRVKERAGGHEKDS